jgi:hypothetical protein
MGYKHTTKLAIMHGSYRYAFPNFQPAGIFKDPPISPCSSVTFNSLKDITGQYLLHEMDYLYFHIGFQQRVMSYPISDTQSLAPDC